MDEDTAAAAAVRLGSKVGACTFAAACILFKRYRGRECLSFDAAMFQNAEHEHPGVVYAPREAHYARFKLVL